MDHIYNPIILVAEDEVDIRTMLTEALTERGYVVREAADGARALALALGEHPDLILLDLLMPEMEGGEVLRRLRADPWGKQAKVIVLTNFEPTDALMREMDEVAPAYYFLKADMDIPELMGKIASVLPHVLPQKEKGGV